MDAIKKNLLKAGRCKRVVKYMRSSGILVGKTVVISPALYGQPARGAGRWREFVGLRRRPIAACGSRGDAAEKAAGLADFARKHGGAFGRIELIRVAEKKIDRLRLHQESIRDRVLRVTDLKHLADLYAQHG